MRAPAVALGTLLLVSAAHAKDDNPPIPEPHIPDAPQGVRDRRGAPAPETHRITKADYPTQIVLRPMTLAEAQAELGLALTYVTNDGDGLFWPTIRAAFGVTRDVELGFTWSAFLAHFAPTPDEKGIDTGKAFSIDGGVTLVPDWFAVRIRLAFYADPDIFGFGLVLGAPFRWRILPRFAVFAGQDLLYIKLAKIAVDPADPARNLGEVANLARQVPTADGRINFAFGGIFQATDTTAVYGTFAIGWDDFSFTDQPYSLYVGVTHTPQKQVDLGLRTGFRRLDHAGDTFTVEVTAALRL